MKVNKSVFSKIYKIFRPKGQWIVGIMSDPEMIVIGFTFGQLILKNDGTWEILI